MDFSSRVSFVPPDVEWERSIPHQIVMWNKTEKFFTDLGIKKRGVLPPMEQNKLDWSLLRDPERRTARIELSDDDYAKQAYQFINAVNLLLQNELQRITTDGQSRADVFWQHNKMHRSTHERGCYGTRVRLLNDYFIAEWYKNVFTKILSNKPQSRYLAKGKDSLKYSKSCFKTANPLWEKALIEQIEQKYAELRAQAAIIYEIRKLLKRYRRLVDITYGE